MIVFFTRPKKKKAVGGSRQESCHHRTRRLSPVTVPSLDVDVFVPTEKKKLVVPASGKTNEKLKSYS